MSLTNSDTIKICWCWPDTDADTRIGVALILLMLKELCQKWELNFYDILLASVLFSCASLFLCGNHGYLFLFQ